jgi:hypothetical protein
MRKEIIETLVSEIGALRSAIKAANDAVPKKSAVKH